MRERIRKAFMITGMICAVSCSLCGCEGKKGMPSEEEQKQIEQDLEKMKQDGILDENGQPMPGVDLRDYPGLG